MKIFNKDKKKNKNIVKDSAAENESLNVVDDSLVKEDKINIDEILEKRHEDSINESIIHLENKITQDAVVDSNAEIPSEQLNKNIDDILTEAKIDLLPANLVIGYYEGMTMKGLKEYINGYVFKYFNAPNITSYKIMKYNSGFIFEIHDGDYKKSYLNTVINEFNNNRNIIYIKTQNRIAKVIKNYNKIETYMLPEAENNNHPDAIFPEKSTMKPIVTTAFGMVPFGLSIAFMGVTSLFLSYIFKTILGKDEELSLPTYTMELPSSYVEKLPLATEIKYVDKVLYSKNVWTKEFKEIKTPKMIKAEKIELSFSKVLTYQNFVNKCFTKSHALDQCNDSNIFFDKVNFANDEFIKNVTMEKGLITVLFKDAEVVKYIPEINENNLLWKIECSSTDIANLCLAPNVIVKNNKKVNTNDASLNNILPENMPVDKDVGKTESLQKKPIIEIQKNMKAIDKKEKEVIKTNDKKEIKETTKSVHEIIKDVKSNDIMKTPKIDEVNKTLQKIEDNAKPLENINNVEKSLNFNNLPDNVVVEKK